MTKNKPVIIYNLVYDILTMAIWAFAFLLLTENILPGFVSGQVSLLKLFLLIFAMIITLSWLGRKINASFGTQKCNNKCLVLSAMFFLANIILALTKFSLSSNIILSTVSILIIYYLYKIYK